MYCCLILWSTALVWGFDGLALCPGGNHHYCGATPPLCLRIPRLTGFPLAFLSFVQTIITGLPLEALDVSFEDDYGKIPTAYVTKQKDKVSLPHGACGQPCEDFFPFCSFLSGGGEGGG